MPCWLLACIRTYGRDGCVLSVSLSTTVYKNQAFIYTDFCLNCIALINLAFFISFYRSIVFWLQKKYMPIVELKWFSDYYKFVHSVNAHLANLGDTGGGGSPWMQIASAASVGERISGETGTTAECCLDNLHRANILPLELFFCAPFKTCFSNNSWNCKGIHLPENAVLKGALGELLLWAVHFDSSHVIWRATSFV